MLAMGTFATMLALDMFNDSSVEAGHPPNVGTAVNTVIARADPNTPGDPAKYTI